LWILISPHDNFKCCAKKQSGPEQSRIFPAYPGPTHRVLTIFQFLLACSSDARLKGNHIILKFIIMKTYLVKSTKRELNETTPVWDAFKDHLENIYFPGAMELLAKDLIAFEYEAYKNERV
jgi:hypothetical protein